MTPYELRNKLSAFILHTNLPKHEGRIIICVSDNWYEARKVDINKQNGEVFIDVGKKIRDSRGDIA